MKKVILSLILFLPLMTIVCHQTRKQYTDPDTESIRINNMIEKIKFIDYYEVIDDLATPNSLKNDTFPDYDYLYILLLDTVHIQLINQYYPRIVNDFRLYYDFLDFSRIENNSRRSQMKFIETELESLKDCFRDERILKEILSNNFGQEPGSNVRLDDEVFIKDDNVAVFWINGIGSDLNKVWKGEKGLYIEHISTTMT
ncbi:hypothetical protein [uncultured Proteiniphilum sp.]|uniref:hypothetical protein n=1 Tax=uncultured Proteiniphilum sp. TaxID=497637 RepID=UPI00260F8691|nr:hypothetical protein [uncultured Proteiniphilum sp.]